jgi:hypothetical protein
LIYAAKFEGLPPNIIVRLEPWTGRIPNLLPAVCYVNRQLFDETVPVLLRGRTIHLNYHGMLPFFDLLGRVSNGAGFRSLTQLKLQHPVHWRKNWFRSNKQTTEDNDLGNIGTEKMKSSEEFIACCPALKHTTLEVDVVSLIGFPVRHDDLLGPRWPRLSDDAIQRAYPIRTLLLCLKLGLFTLICQCIEGVGTSIIRRLTGVEDQHFWDPLVAWFRERLAEEMPQVKFNVEYASKPKDKDFVGFRLTNHD